ncbi:nitrate assimilation regulatory protein nirA [Boeremia exigua]|uniref:nitrate assimilation regulatory protein nirA n=1 Tax=Boeremia exigua TaxID=749465 RepID=UPI001E8D440B|nr:nitrate assimilation regulatory protein nirA [Boeremia exigua]KAH6643025.1 nitrate assimilation regulatory protein nirA [Boeremia exigua]
MPHPCRHAAVLVATWTLAALSDQFVVQRLHTSPPVPSRTHISAVSASAAILYATVLGRERFFGMTTGLATHSSSTAVLNISKRPSHRPLELRHCAPAPGRLQYISSEQSDDPGVTAKMQPVFRQLAPAPPHGNPEPSGSEPRKRKRKARLACNHCRLKRVGCDGTRPECTRCLRARVPCVYLSDDAEATPTMALKSEVENLQRRLQEHSDFLQNLFTAPEDEILNIVRQLRSADGASALPSSYQSSAVVPTQLSEHVPARAVMASPESGIELELVMRHPTAYPALISPSPSSITSAKLTGGSAQTTPSGTTSSSPSDPYTYCDPRLENLSVGYWTRIPIDDELAARAISHFLTTDHPVLGLFDADLFIRDLVNQGLNHCSSFLFHSVMSLACQSYSAENLQIVPFATAFTEEALKLWHAERSTDSTPTLAALNCLSVATAWNGRNELGNHQLLADARAMATRMQLLDVPPSDTAMDQFQDLAEDELRDRAHVAWGSYGWQSFCASFFPKSPIKYPPNFPIPGDHFDIFATLDTFGPAHPSPDYVGHTFTAMSQFWVIVQEILAVYSMQDESPLVDRVIPSFAEAKYRKLLAWADTLPKELGNSSNSAAHVYLFHALYHTTILNLFRPFCNPPDIIRLRSFSSADSTSRNVFSASVKQLKRLVYNYRTYVPRRLARSIIFNAAVLHLSSIIVHQADIDSSWRFFFRICFDYWKDVYVCYRVVAGIVPAHLSLALQAGAITPKEAKALKDEFVAVGRHHKMADGVLTDAYVDFHRAIRKEEGATMHELAKRFDELMMFEDFTQELGDVERW